MNCDEERVDDIHYAGIAMMMMGMALMTLMTVTNDNDD